MTNTSDFSDDLFLTKNWAGWSKLQISNNSAASDSWPELRLLGNQSARVFLERDGGTHQCELIMINDGAVAQTKSLSTQLSLTTNQRNPGCLVIAGNTGNVVCNTSFRNLSDSRVKTEMVEADVAALRLRGGQAVQAPGHERGPEAGLRLGRLRRNKMEEPDGHSEVERRLRLLSPHQRALGSVQGLPGPAGQGGSLAGPAGAEEAIRNMADARRRTIKAVYKNPRTGFGSIAQTLQQAQVRDPSISREKVKAFLDGLPINQDRPQRGYNSFVPLEPMNQLQTWPT